MRDPATTSEGHPERVRRYRRQGWWPGDRIEERYERVVRSRPSDVAVVDSHGSALTHEQLWRESGDLARDLAAHGVGAGSVVALVLPNWSVWQVALLAVLRLRAVPATIPVVTDPRTLGAMLASAEARVVIAPTRFRNEVSGDAIADVARGCDSRCDALLVDATGTRRWSVADAGAMPAPIEDPRLDHLMFTSSTTGLPKPVMHSADTIAALNIGFRDRYDLGADRPIFMPSPLGHSVGAMHGARLSWFLGAPLVLQDVWDPEQAIALVDRHRCSFTAAATPFLKDLVDAPARGNQAKLATLEVFLCGGAQVPASLIERAEEELPNTFVSVLWGMTEGGVTTCAPGTAPAKVKATAGQPLPGLELRVVSPDGDALETGAEGELVMRGPGVFLGYWGQEDLYRSTLTPEGFFRTGDQARLDGEGFVTITGRIKDLIVRGGVNISPVPIEDALSSHPNVAGVAVIGVPHERMGERICAVIEPVGDQPSVEDILAWVERRGLPRRFWPEHVEFVEEVPRTAAGKIRKQELRLRLGRG